MKTHAFEKIWLELGIGREIVTRCKLPLQEEATNLASAGPDVFDREQFMTLPALQCWQQMKAAAEEDGIDLLIVSAYRSVDYQCGLIRNKLAEGQLIEEIVRVSAIPGFSEHHTGNAVDITTANCEPLDESFDQTSAFQWLKSNAVKFDFMMSYPKDNPFDIVYEPWHWACQRT